MWGIDLREVRVSHNVQTAMGEKEKFELNSEVAREPVEGVKGRGDVFIFTHLHQDSDSVLDILPLLKALPGIPNVECGTIIEPREDKGIKESSSRRTRRDGQSLAILRRWKKGDLQMWLI